MQGKVVVGMSGGVDSSVAAYLLQKQGYEVIGVTMQMLSCNPPGIEDAGNVASHLGISHQVLHFENEFSDNVIDYFVKEYINGRTPNPCVVCNRHIKWEALLQYADSIGASYIATGHYARIVELPNGRLSVKLSASASKDQTYVLYNLTQEQLKHTLMPLGIYEKSQIREIAKIAEIPVAEKSDSMEICFIPDNDYGAYIADRCSTSNLMGNFVTTDGDIIGPHKGIFNYTIGQRKGLGIAMGKPIFVSDIRPETGEVVVGDESAVFSDELYTDTFNLMGADSLNPGDEFIAKIRYGHKGTPCYIDSVNDNRVHIIFREPVRAITPGQSVVLYKDDIVMGGGAISRRTNDEFR